MDKRESTRQAIGEQIKSRREELGLTQKMLGKRVGWSDSRIGAYERGEHYPSKQAIKILSEALSIELQ